MHRADMDERARRTLIARAMAQHGVITRHDANALNFDRRRITTALRAGWLAEPLPGVLVLTDSPATWHQRLATVVHSAGGRGVASHRSAARLHGFDGLESAGNAVIEVSVTRRFRLDPAAATVTHHVTPLDAVDVTSVAGIVCTTRNRTLCDLGAVCDRRMVRRALTSARRSGIDLRAVRAVAERLHRPGIGHRRDHATARRHPVRGTAPATWFEELLHLCLTDRALPPVCPSIRSVTARADRRPHRSRNPVGEARARGTQPALPLRAGRRAARRGPRPRRRCCGWELDLPRVVRTRRPPTSRV